MALRDPVDKNLLRMEVRRFATRCDGQIASIERADTLREVSRLATSMTLPYAISGDYSARDALRVVQTRAEDRARKAETGDVRFLGQSHRPAGLVAHLGAKQTDSGRAADRLAQSVLDVLRQIGRQAGQ
jgi:hypothetical protein